MARIQQKALTSDLMHATFFKVSLKQRKWQAGLHPFPRLTTCLNSYSVVHLQGLLEGRSRHLRLAHWSVKEHSPALHQSLSTHQAERRGCYQDRHHSLRRRSSGRVRCIYLSSAGILLEEAALCGAYTCFTHKGDNKAAPPIWEVPGYL